MNLRDAGIVRGFAESRVIWNDHLVVARPRCGEVEPCERARAVKEHERRAASGRQNDRLDAVYVERPALECSHRGSPSRCSVGEHAEPYTASPRRSRLRAPGVGQRGLAPEITACCASAASTVESRHVAHRYRSERNPAERSGIANGENHGARAFGRGRAAASARSRICRGRYGSTAPRAARAGGRYDVLAADPCVTLRTRGEVTEIATRDGGVESSRGIAVRAAARAARRRLRAARGAAVLRRRDRLLRLRPRPASRTATGRRGRGRSDAGSRRRRLRLGRRGRSRGAPHVARRAWPRPAHVRALARARRAARVAAPRPAGAPVSRAVARELELQPLPVRGGIPKACSATSATATAIR